MKRLLLTLFITVSGLHTGFAQCNLGFTWQVNNCTSYGACNGSITLTVPGGTAPYTFGINGGTLVTQTVNSTTYTFTGLCAGTYSMYVWDQSMTPCNCTSCGAGPAPTATVTQPAPNLYANAYIGLPTCIQDFGAGYFQVNFGGSAPPFELSLNGGMTWFPATSPYMQYGLDCQSAPLFIYVRDATGQTLQASYSTPANYCISAPTSSITIESDCGGTCQGRIGISIPALNWDSYAPYSVWVQSFTTGYMAYNTPLTSPNDTIWVENVCAGNQFRYWIGTSIGCSYYAPLGPYTMPNSTVAPTPSVTAGGPLTFCPGGSVTLTSSISSNIQWSNGATSASITVSAPGSYYVTNDPNGNCPSVSASQTVSLYPAPVVDAGTNLSVCEGNSATLNANGNCVSYNWNNGISDGVAFTPPTGTSTYTLTGTDANGCTGTDNVLVTANALPVVDAGANQMICIGDMATLYASGAAVYVWDNGITDGVPFTPAPGTLTYTVTGTDVNGCENTDQVDVTVNSLPNVYAGSDQILCDGGQVTLSGTGATSYSWDNGISDGISFTPAPGTLTYTVTGTDVNGCENTDQVDVTVNALPNVYAGSDQMLCDGGQVTLSGTGATSYSWDNGISDGISFTPAPGTLTYTVTGTDASGCENTDQVDVTVNALPNVYAGSDQILCDGGQVTLSGTGATSYSWDNGISDGISFTPTPGTLTYTVTGTDANGCENTDQVDVTVNSLPNVYAGNDQTLCTGDSVLLSGTGASAYLWSSGNANGTYYTPGTGVEELVLTGTDLNGCDNRDTIVLSALPLPLVTLTGENTLCVYSPVTTLTGTPAGGTFSGATNSSVFDPALQGVGIYTVVYTYTDGFGCENSDSLQITVSGCAGLNSETLTARLYPNPVHDLLTVELEGVFTATLCNIEGQILGHTAAWNKASLSLASLDAGIYLILLHTEDQQTTYRVVKH